MRRLAVFTLFASVLALAGVSLPAGEQKESKSALESRPDGWVNLVADGLKHWKRVPIPPGGKLKEPSPWGFDEKAGTIVCNGKGYHEMLLYEKELTNGIFHAEWKFEKVEGGKGYNSGVYARNSADGKTWIQAQVGSKNVGFFFGDVPEGDKYKRFRSQPLKGEQRGREAGEWNTYEITCRDNAMTLWVNGAVTTRWEECPVPGGYVGLEAEGWVIEFKNLKWLDVK